MTAGMWSGGGSLKTGFSVYATAQFNPHDLPGFGSHQAAHNLANLGGPLLQRGALLVGVLIAVIDGVDGVGRWEAKGVSCCAARSTDQNFT